MKNIDEKNINQIVNEFYLNYLELFRDKKNSSSKKVNGLHKNIAVRLTKELGSKYTIHHALNLGEKKIVGYVMNKKCDITIMEGNCIKAIISVKTAFVNYNQNANNYIEALIGEAWNIKEEYKDDVKFYYFFIAKRNVPYNKKGKRWADVQTITDTHIDKYRKLCDSKIIDDMFIYIIDFEDDKLISKLQNTIFNNNDVILLINQIIKKGNQKLSSNTSSFSKENQIFLEDKLDFNLFIKSIKENI